ncbi:MAG: PKD domain-containing protein [Bacteroidales bacterium]
MKNKIVILTVLLMLSFQCFSQYNIHIHGYVRNSITLIGIPNHQVHIVGDSIYTPGFIYNKWVNTDTNGFYSDTINITFQQGALLVETFDCNNIALDTLLYFNSLNTFLSSDFIICVDSNTSCQADFIALQNYCDKCVSFTDSSWSAGNITSWVWGFGDGTGDTSQNPVHCYNNFGTYTVCLTVFDTMNNCSNQFCNNIYIDSAFYINADFSFSLDPIANIPNAFIFYDNSNGNITSWLWDFGDGTTSTLQNPYHLFPDSGIYNVCLTILNNFCSGTICHTITVIPLNKYNIGGQVFAGSYPIDNGTAYLYSVFNNQITLTDSMSFSIDGYFYFYHAPEGNYIVKVESDINSAVYDQYAPTYFGNALKWNNASIISLNDSIYNADVNMLNVTSSSGPCSISGSLIFYGSAVPYSEILLLNLNGNPVYYTYTDTYGTFGFSNIAYGTYILYAEEAGKYTIPDTITLNANNPVITNVELSLFDTNPSGIIINDNLTPTTIGNIYPNPVLKDLNFEINLASSADLTVRIFNTIGRQIKENKITLTNGKHLIRLPANDLPGGIYLLNISSADGKINEVKKFIK